MDLDTFYAKKKILINYIGLYEIIVNSLVFALFIYGMHIQKIRPAFGIFVAGPALAIAVFFCPLFLQCDQQGLREHKYFLNQFITRFVFACFNLVTCINVSGKVYWMHDSFIRNSFLIYIVSAAFMIPITVYFVINEKKVVNEIYERKNQENTAEQTNNNDNISINEVELVENHEENKDDNEVPNFVVSVVDCGAANPLDIV